MSTVGLVLLGILAAWGGLSLVLTIADMVIRRRNQEMLAMREWREKVDAMRRLGDEEGDA